MTNNKKVKGGRRSRWKLGGHTNIPELPLDIMLNIISRLPSKLIIGCKSLSKAFNNLISAPSFNPIYLSNNSTYFHCLFVDESGSKSKSEPVFCLDLLEFPIRVYDKNRYCKISKRISCFNSNTLPQASDFLFFSIWGYCNGLFCFLKIESRLFKLFLINPILGEFIQLPDPFPCDISRMVLLAYGLGYCQFTNKYKALSIFSVIIGDRLARNTCHILTIGSDSTWRAVKDSNVPYNLKLGHTSVNSQSDMVAFRSALHWIVQPVKIIERFTTEPTWGGTRYICAFDMTDEKVTAFPFPPELAACQFYGQLILLSDKLCLWEDNPSCYNIELWVMNEYGVQGSWSKQFTFKRSSLPKDIHTRWLKPLTISPGGLVLVTDCHRLLFYDLQKNKCLKVIPQTDHVSYPIPFVPTFLSLKNLVQDS